MHMTVEQILGMVLVQQFPQGGKTHVRTVFTVAQPFRRAVGHYDIHTAAAPQLEAQFADALAHLFFGVLEFAVPILAAAA